jgi:RimJ/RimL family protein N-acetyltransferase
MKNKIITKDFVLRPFKKGDEFSLAKNINDKEIIRNTLIPFYPYKLKNAKDWVRKNLKEDEKKKPKMFNFVIDINGEVTGSVGFSRIEKRHQALLGFWLAKKYWNKGIMTKAVKLITEFGFGKMGFKRIYADVLYFNKSSMRVLEKADFQLEGILRKSIKKDNKLIDDYLFAKVR